MRLAPLSAPLPQASVHASALYYLSELGGIDRQEHHERTYETYLPPDSFPSVRP